MSQRRVLTNFTANVFAQTFNKLFPILIYSYAQAKLSTPLFGFALIAITLVDWTSPLIEAGTTQFGQIAVGRQKYDASAMGKLLGEILSIKAINAVLAFVGLLAWTHFRYPDYFSSVLPLSFLLFGSILDMTYVQVATQRIWSLSAFNTVSKLLGLAGILLWVRAPGDQLWFAMLLVGTNVVYSVATFVNACSSWRPILPTVQTIRSLYRSIAPYSLLIFLFFSLERFDLLFIENFFGVGAVGLYGGASRIFLSLHTLIPALALAFGAEMLSLSDDDAFSRQLTHSVAVVSTFVFPVAIGSWFVAGDLLTLIYDPTYHEVARAFSILCLGLIPQMIFYTCGMNALLPRGHIRWVNLTLIVGLMVGLGSAWFFARDGGVTTIAAANLLSKLVIAAAILMKAKRYLSYNAIKHVGRIVLATGVMAAALWGCQLVSVSLVPKVMAGAMTFALCLLVLNRDLAAVILSRAKNLG